MKIIFPTILPAITVGIDMDIMDNYIFFEGRIVVQNGVPVVLEDIVESQPDAVMVEGAGHEEANGLYIAYINPEDVKDYAKVGSNYFEGWPNSVIAFSVTSQWLIYVEINPPESVNRYQGSTVDSIDVIPSDTLEWSTVLGGAAPAPTVRQATWEDIDAAGIDRSTVPTL